MWLILFIALITTKTNCEELKKNWAFIGNALLIVRPCEDNVPVYISYEAGRSPSEENNYDLSIDEKLPIYSRVEIKFDSPASLTLLNSASKNSARIEVVKDEFLINFFDAAASLQVRVQGPPTGTIPYITSLKINYQQYCTQPKVGILDKYLKGHQETAQISLTVPDDTCGRRKVTHTGLITNGLRTKPGDWPWHAALYKLEKQSLRYICGGSLISKTIILTAAHCVTDRYESVIPELLTVFLGKYSLIGRDIGSQEKEVHQVIVHEKFDPSRLDNDIAVLKLKSEVQYSDYVQPVCIWKPSDLKKLPSPDINGIVTGWGYDETDNLSAQLHQAVMPIISETVCIKSNPLFYSRLLNEYKFCAGFKNGTAACNGDSGGGYLIFVPDVPQDSSSNGTGTWHIKGITSLAAARRNIALCDPNQYVIFTDVEKYDQWLIEKMS